jgi:ADP-heptose synthase, bifunctional sugar kinase/adenylyltransferase
MPKNCFSLNETKNIVQQKSLKLLIVGDGCCDYTHYGSIKRISQEAPVPIFDLDYTESKLGMTYNVKENFINLGLTDIDSHTFVIENKHRYIEKKFSHQVYRVDEKTNTQLDILDAVLKSIEENTYDAVVISDYDKGTLSYQNIEQIIKSCKPAPVFIDTKKKDLAKFKNCIVKINEDEYQNSVSHSSKMIVTRSDKDVLYLENGKTVENFPVDKVDLHDVTGAGDSFLSAFVVYFMATNSLQDAINFAIKSSQITVQKVGVYAPRLEEICQD